MNWFLKKFWVIDGDSLWSWPKGGKTAFGKNQRERYVRSGYLDSLKPLQGQEAGKGNEWEEGRKEDQTDAAQLQPRNLRARLCAQHLFMGADQVRKAPTRMSTAGDLDRYVDSEEVSASSVSQSENPFFLHFQGRHRQSICGMCVWQSLRGLWREVLFQEFAPWGAGRKTHGTGWWC